jgi:hypothetical protein
MVRESSESDLLKVDRRLGENHPGRPQTEAESVVCRLPRRLRTDAAACLRAHTLANVKSTASKKWRTPWLWSTAVLGVALIVMARRLSDVQVELERARAYGHPVQTNHDGAVHSDDGQPIWAAIKAADMAAEWEQAVLPTDS